MPQQLCFKTRRGARTVQLVRHVYSPAVKRSRTVTVGSLPLDANPEDFHPDLRLRADMALSEADRLAIAAWLERHGDAQARERRRATEERIAARVRAELSTSMAAPDLDVLQEAVVALDALTEALPTLARAAEEAGKSARAELRPGYLDVSYAWNRLVEVAQACGVAKTAKRGQKTEAAPSS